MSKIPCELVQDLLPNYIEKLTGEKSTELIRQHLESCEKCRKAYQSMTGEEAVANEDSSSDKRLPAEQKEIDFLKKNRRRNRRIVIGCILGGLLLTASLLYAWIFLIGSKSDGTLIYCDVQVDGRHITAKGSVIDSLSVVRKIRFKEQDGVVTMTPVTVWASVFHRGGFLQKYDAKEEIREVRMGDQVLWRKTEVSDISSRLSEDVLENYREWDRKSEAEQMLSSRRPGFVEKYFESWEEAETYLGYQFENPFEGAKGYGIMNTAGADIVSPSDGVLEHVSVSFAGNREGEILWLCITSGYQTKGIRVVYRIEPFGRLENLSLSYGENGLTYDNTVPIGVQVSDGAHVSSEAEVSSFVTARSSEAGYTAEDIRYRREGISYSVRLVSFSGEEALNEAEASVLSKIDK